MDDNIYYEAFGGIGEKTPLEPFYNAMLPLFKNYGLTAQFPADKPSLAYNGMMGIKFVVQIGEPPATIRYQKCEGSAYSNEGLEMILESETLVHTETGEKLAVKIFITDYPSKLSGAGEHLWLTVKFIGEQSEVERFKNAVAPVLSEYNFRSKDVKTGLLSEATKDNSPADSSNNSKSDFATNNSNFDEPARSKTLAPGAVGKMTAEDVQAGIDREMPQEKPDQLTRLLEENAELIARLDQENEMFSAMIAGGAEAMDEADEEERARVISRMANLFESVRVKHHLSLKLFGVFIETCLQKRKFLIPVLAFAYLRQDAARMKKLERDKELFDEFTRWLTEKISPAAKILLDKPVQKSAALVVKAANETPDVGKDGADNLETSTAPFDELARKINQPNALREDLNRLFAAVFDLREWQFISRGELPDVRPYMAANAAFAGNQPMIRAFTDSKRLIRFVKENNLSKADGSCDSLTIPTANVVEYLEGFIPDGAYGVWFNSDSESDGFFIPIKQLRPIKEHLSKLNQPPRSNTDGEIEPDITVNKVGTVNLETPIAPLLEDYKETGEIDDKTPLEPFYEAMLPVLADYGFAEKFPDGKISTLSGGYTGYEYDVFIGAPPSPAFRYTNVMPGGYSTFSDEQRSLESVGLSHSATGAEIFVRIDIKNAYSGGKLCLNLEISGAESEVERFKIAFAPVLIRYNFESQKAEENIGEARPDFAGEDFQD